MATPRTKTRSKAAPKPTNPKIEDRDQYERFQEFAREHEADDVPEAFDRQVRKIVIPKGP